MALGRIEFRPENYIQRPVVLRDSHTEANAILAATKARMLLEYGLKLGYRSTLVCIETREHVYQVTFLTSNRHSQSLNERATELHHRGFNRSIDEPHVDFPGTADFQLDWVAKSTKYLVKAMPQRVLIQCIRKRWQLSEPYEYRTYIAAGMSEDLKYKPPLK